MAFVYDCSLEPVRVRDDPVSGDPAPAMSCNSHVVRIRNPETNDFVDAAHDVLEVPLECTSFGARLFDGSPTRAAVRSIVWGQHRIPFCGPVVEHQWYIQGKERLVTSDALGTSMDQYDQRVHLSRDVFDGEHQKSAPGSTIGATPAKSSALALRKF